MIRLGIAMGILIIFICLTWIPHLSYVRSLPCGFYELTGLPCLFCGGNRAMLAVREGQWKSALYLNPLVFPILLSMLVIFGLLFMEATFGKVLSRWERWADLLFRSAPLLILLIVGFWLLHIILAIQYPKPELVNMHHPIASKMWFIFNKKKY